MAPLLSSFSDTAYALRSMDLLITVDTAMAHLAGALGVPTLLLVSYIPDWRWMMGRVDSPWYPTLRIYRQPEPGNWASVIERVVADLTHVDECRLSVLEGNGTVDPEIKIKSNQIKSNGSSPRMPAMNSNPSKSTRKSAKTLQTPINSKRPVGHIRDIWASSRAILRHGLTFGNLLLDLGRVEEACGACKQP